MSNLSLLRNAHDHSRKCRTGPDPQKMEAWRRPESGLLAWVPKSPESAQVLIFTDRLNIIRDPETTAESILEAMQ